MISIKEMIRLLEEARLDYKQLADSGDCGMWSSEGTLIDENLTRVMKSLHKLEMVHQVLNTLAGMAEENDLPKPNQTSETRE